MPRWTKLGLSNHLRPTFESGQVTSPAQQKAGAKVVFSVPTGNFGNVLAGFYAKQMGLPVHHFIVATNQNE